MSAAHSIVLAQMVHLLADLPEGVIIRRAATHTHHRVVVDFPTRAIEVNHAASFAEFVVDLLLGIVHLDRGPCRAGDEAREEQIVREHVARLLVDPEQQIELTHVTDPSALAAMLGIDETTARLGMELARRSPTTEDSD